MSQLFLRNGDTMANNIKPTTSASSPDKWKRLFEAALLERDPVVLERRLQVAKDAILDHIEDSFRTASLSERRLLLASLNTISELRRLAKVDESRQPLLAQTLSHAA
jgi:hypothetical protein